MDKTIIVELLISYYLYIEHLKHVNLRVSSHCVVVGRYDVDCVTTNKLCNVDVPRLTRPDSFPDQTAEGKATQIVWVDSPTRSAKVVVAFKQMWWKTTVATSTLGIVRADTAEVSQSRHSTVCTRLRNCNIHTSCD